jgi:hypothetical protein
MNFPILRRAAFCLARCRSDMFLPRLLNDPKMLQCVIVMTSL